MADNQSNGLLDTITKINKIMEDFRNFAGSYVELKKKIAEISGELKKLKAVGISISKITDNLSDIGTILEKTIGGKDAGNKQ